MIILALEKTWKHPLPDCFEQDQVEKVIQHVDIDKLATQLLSVPEAKGTFKLMSLIERHCDVESMAVLVSTMFTNY